MRTSWYSTVAIIKVMEEQDASLETLGEAAMAGEGSAIKQLWKEMLPEYTPELSFSDGLPECPRGQIMNDQGTERILVMEKDGSHSATLVSRLSQLGYCAESACSGDEAQKAMDKGDFSLLIACAELPDWGGPRSPERLGTSRKKPTMLVTCDLECRESALRCIQKGAYDFLPRECEMSRLEVTVERALAERCLAAKTKRCRLMAMGLALSTPGWIGLGMGLAHFMA